MQDKNVLLNLITSVKNHSKLYANFTQNDVDDINEWTAVARECAMSVAEAQDQWNNLMHKYVDYLRNNQNFCLAQHMDFLQPHFFAINEKENIDEMELLKAIDAKDFEDTILISTKHKDNKKTVLNIGYEVENEIKTKEQKPHNLTLSNISEVDPITNMSSLELIFLGYAKQLQSMPLALQLSAKRKIADVMDEAELANDEFIKCLKGK